MKKLLYEEKIFSSIDKNLKFLKSKYNTEINSDIISKEFILTAHNKQYKAFIFNIDGMVDSDLINDFILNPLMIKDENNSLTKSKFNNFFIPNIKKMDLSSYVLNCLVPQNNIEKVENFSDAISGINSGNCLLFIDTLNVAFDIDVKGFKQRGVEAPQNEIIIYGPHEAFTENIRTNTSLIRRIVNNENLIIENIEIGEISRTKCGLCYMANITNTKLVDDVKYRLKNLSIDSLISSGELEQLIEDSAIAGIPQIISTERPDKCSKYLLQGRVVVLINGNPYALIMPATIADFLFSSEDTNLNPIFANFLRLLRFFAFITTLLLPGLYIAITSFHQEILPTELLYSILDSRENVPFPIIIELLLMEISFELIREAGLRVPSPIGSTIGIVGGLILGESAVSANIVSSVPVIIVALNGIASFAIPNYSFSFHVRIFRFVFIFLGFMAGFLGISLGLFIYICMLCSLTSFGVPYTAPFAPLVDSKKSKYFVSPIWKQEYRSSLFLPKKQRAQEKISMKWKYQK
jgi:spore germination protein KA